MNRSTVPTLLMAMLLIATACSDNPATSTTPVTQVELSPSNSGLSSGDTLHFTVALWGETGRLADRMVAWSSSNPAVATVNASGVATGVSNGTTFIRAESEGIVDSIALKVSNTFTVISVGDRSACALSPTRAAYCWGNAITGRLGWSGGQDTAAPVPVAGGHLFARLATGGGHTCGITAAGAAWCWGTNFYGELDQSPPDNNSFSATPLSVNNNQPLVSITVSDNYSCGLDAAGVPFCWGLPCGLDVNGSYFCWNVTSSPIAFDAIDAGSSHICGIATSGLPYCWGENNSGELGVDTASGSASPVLVTLPAGVRSISAGDLHSCAVTVNDDGFCWGRNAEGQLGTGNLNPSTTPVLVSGGHKWALLTAGALETCGMSLEGTTYCWGYLGFTGTSLPLAVSSGHFFDQISVEAGTACGHTQGGGVYCWGNGNDGQLGNGIKANTQKLIRVLDP